MDPSQEAFDATKADEATNVDVVTSVDVVLLNPLSDGGACLEEGVESEEGWPGRTREGR